MYSIIIVALYSEAGEKVKIFSSASRNYSPSLHTCANLCTTRESVDDTTSTERLHKNDKVVEVLHVKLGSLGTRLECGYELLSYTYTAYVRS